MDLNASVGVRISVQDFDKSKMLIFNKPVKCLQLSEIEATKLGASLLTASQKGFTAHLRRLIESGFFKQPRKLGEIKSQLFLDGADVKISSLQMLLIKMADRRELKREIQKGAYHYVEVNV